MPTIDNWRALRDALEAGPTEGPWAQCASDVFMFGRKEGNGTEPIGFVYGPSFAERSEYGRRTIATARYIAAAHPAAIRSLLDERDRIEANAERLAAEQAVMRQWIAEALPWIQGQQSLYPNHELGTLCESGRRLVDGGPDDLLAGVE